MHGLQKRHLVNAQNHRFLRLKEYLQAEQGTMIGVEKAQVGKEENLRAMVQKAPYHVHDLL